MREIILTISALSTVIVPAYYVSEHQNQDRFHWVSGEDWLNPEHCHQCGGKMRLSVELGIKVKECVRCGARMCISDGN